MVRKRANLRLVACAGWFLLLASPSICFALPVDMGTAGPTYWTVLQTGGGTITVTPPASKSTKPARKRKSAIATTIARVAITGNVGVGEGGQILDNGAQIEGDLYLDDNTSAQFTGTYTNNSPVNGAVRMGNGSTISPTAGYSFNDSNSALQPAMNQVQLDAIAASAAASSLAATSSLSQISLSRGKSLTLSSGVYDLTSLQLTRSTLTLSGSGSFVFNITSAFALSSAQILLANGATEANVLFNYTGTSDINISAAGKKGSSSTLHGIILAMNANVNLAQGLVVGEIISGRNIMVGANSLIQAGLPNIGLPLNSPTQSVPDETSTIVLSAVALCLLVAFRPFFACRLGRTRRMVGA